MLERNTENEIGAVRHPQREVVGVRAIYVIEGLTDRHAQLASLQRQGVAVCNVHEHKADEPCNERCAQGVRVTA